MRFLSRVRAFARAFLAEPPRFADTPPVSTMAHLSGTDGQSQCGRPLPLLQDVDVPGRVYSHTSTARSRIWLQIVNGEIRFSTPAEAKATRAHGQAFCEDCWTLWEARGRPGRWDKT